jgi:hypothetical protein
LRIWIGHPSNMNGGKMGNNYVDITKEDFEQWLKQIPYVKTFKIQPGTRGVYIIPLSKSVAISITSTLGMTSQTKGYAKASMKMRLVSLISGRVLNKKAQGQNHFKRTLNWRVTWKKGLDRLRDTYLKAATFYDRIASVEDRDKYQRDMITKITSIQDWQSNKFLEDLHSKVSQGMILSEKQEAAIDKLSKQPSPKNVAEKFTDQEFMRKLRNLWATIKKKGDTRTLSFVESLGKQYAQRGSLSDKQMQVIEKLFGQHRIK